MSKKISNKLVYGGNCVGKLIGLIQENSRCAGDHVLREITDKPVKTCRIIAGLLLLGDGFV